MSNITTIATSTVSEDGIINPPVPRNMEVAELKIKQLRVNMSNGLIQVEGDKGHLAPTPNRVPRSNANSVIDDGWLTDNIVRDPSTVVRTTTLATSGTPGIVKPDDTTTTINGGVLTAPAPIVVPWTLTAAVAVDDLVPVPRAYIVGSNEFVLYKNGMALAEGDYEEVGPVGELSTLIKAKFTAVSGDKLMLYGPFALRPLLVIDPSQGVVDPRLVCTRAGSTWVTGPDGKITEVPANVVPIDWSTGVGRIACFGQRTRLNKYYKTLNSNWQGDATLVTKTQVVDESSPTGTIIRYVRTDKAATQTILTGYTISQDIGTSLLEQDTVCSERICARCNRTENFVIDFIYTNGTVNAISEKEIILTPEFQVFDFTATIPAGNYLSSARLKKKNSTSTDAGLTIDIAYIQVEQSSCATPLIAGPEGQQVTVPFGTVAFRNATFPNGFSLFSDADILDCNLGHQNLMRVQYIDSGPSLYRSFWNGLDFSFQRLILEKSVSDFLSQNIDIPRSGASKKCVFTFKNNTKAKLSLIGKLAESNYNAIGTLSNNKATLWIGGSTPIYPSQSFISKVIVWDRVLPDAQLKALTAE